MHNSKEKTLDPANWETVRELGHRMLDEVFNQMSNIREMPVWRALQEENKLALETGLPVKGSGLDSVYQEFREHIQPFYLGNIHPRFWGWVCGTGSANGVLADMLAAGMNSTASFGPHAAMYVENQVLNWTKQMFDFPPTALGLLTTGASMANIIALATARNHFDKNIRKNGLKKFQGQLLIYASSETHSCVQKAAELLGIGSDHLRKIKVDENYKIRIGLLEEQITQDVNEGYLPFCIIGNAGTVNTGSLDDLDALADIAKKHNCWFHIDGAFGAAPNILPEYKSKLKGLEKADSVALDFHKWFYVNYDAGCVLIRDAKAHKDSFQINANYLMHHDRGIIAGNLNYNHLGVELSRGFRALKIWMAFKEFGLETYQQLIRQNLAQAQYLAERIEASDHLQLMAPVPMNIVCFRYYHPELSTDELNHLNKQLLMNLHEEGIAAPSFTILKGQYVIRVAITNHRSRKKDFDLLVKETIRIGNGLFQERPVNA